MPKPRLPVRDLEAPERIQPAPVQSDTYAKPAQPPIDHSLEELQKGLAVFGSGVNALASHRKVEEEKRLRTEQLAAYEAWKASVSSDEHLDAIRSGKLPINVDRILDTVVKKDGAQHEALKLAEEIDRDIGTAGLGSAGFDADAYVRGKAQPFVSRIARDPRTMAYFGDHIDRIRSGIQRRHEDVRGQLQTQYMEDRGRQEIADGIRSGVEQQMAPQKIMDALRNPNPSKGIYAAVGPRLKKGSLDLSYGRMDEITLDILEDMAQRPETALTAMGMLTAQRSGIDGQPIGPLTAVHKHSAKIDTIQRKVLKTLGDHEERARKALVDEANLSALERGGGTFSTIKDLKGQNPADLSRDISYSRDAQRDKAVSTWIEKSRAVNGGKVDFPGEIDFLMDRGIKHPEFEKVLNEAYAGFLSSSLAGKPATDRIPRIVSLGDEYTRIAERNWAFAQDLVAKDAREFYETYRVLRQFAGRSPDVAAAETAMAFSNPATAKDPTVLLGNQRRIEETINGMDLQRWWPGGQVVNHITVRQQLMPLAKALARVEGVKTEEVLERAAAHIEQRAAYVNGNVVLSPAIHKGDEKFVQAYFDAIFKEHGAALKGQGVSSSSKLSLFPEGGQSLVVVKAGGGVVTVPTEYDEGGKPRGLGILRITPQDILRLRQAGRERAAAEGVEALKKHMEVQKDPWLPSNILRRMIEGGEVVPVGPQE